MKPFADLGLKSEFVDALEKVGYTTPTPIQEQAIPELVKGSDVIGQAQTGTGKTAAFGLPMLQAVIAERREVQGLVLTPTRELCIQVAQSLRAYGQVAGIDVLATFGGAPIRQQMDRLKSGPQVVVGTVGRVLDLHSRHALMFHDARFVVLDEADEMLDLGFLEDVEMILKKCPRGRQTALFSATMPAAIAKLAEEHLHDPVTIKVKAPTLTIDTVDHFQASTTRNTKVQDLIKILESERPTQAIIFARTKIGVDRLARDLDRSKPALRVRALHGDMSQGSRDGVMIAFKDNRVPVLVATDIAARGLDVQNVTHVINYDLPNSAEIYTHRIGRTGRAGRGGRAITLVEPRDKEDFIAIEKHINVKVPEWSPGAASPQPDRKQAAAAPAAASPASADAEPKGERTPRKRRARGGEEQSQKQPPTDQATDDLVSEAKPEPEEQQQEGFSWGSPAPSETKSEATPSASSVSQPAPDAPVEAEEAAPEAPAPEEAAAPDAPEAEAPRSPAQAKPAASFSWGPPAEGEQAQAEQVEDAKAEAETPAPPEEPAAEEARELRRPRHVKPDQSELDDDFSLLIVSGGSKSGVEPADVIELITSKSDLTGSDVRRVRVLSRYTLMQVPSEKASGVAVAIDGAELRGERVAADAVIRSAGS